MFCAAPSLPVEPVRLFSRAMAAPPAAAQFVELLSYDVPAGRELLLNLFQAVELDEAGPLGDGRVVVPGVQWEARLQSLEGASERVVQLTPDGPSVPWTLTAYGAKPLQPIVRGLSVPARTRLRWGVRWDPAVSPSVVRGLGGALLGFLVSPGQMSRAEWLSLHQVLAGTTL